MNPNLLIHKKFESDNEASHKRMPYKDISQKAPNKVQIFYQPKKFKYSETEELSPANIQKLEEGNKKFPNKDLRFFNGINFTQKIVFIRINNQNKEGLNQKQIYFYEKIKSIS
ncbi:MAG: hypothetical protein MJ252_19710, partial [archaeon]|nr:hypothetical protein [archaeon]